MEKVKEETTCRSVFRSSDQEDLRREFTRLWLFVIKSQEEEKCYVTDNNCVLQAKARVI